ncbi:MAG: hypothetical protein ABIJ21_03115 [Nanoarchaeota archaeon]
MDKQLRKAFLIGLGVTILTKERVEKEVKAFMKEHRITETESKRLAKRIIREGVRHKKEIAKKIRSMEEELKTRVKNP